jgi:hypothetical protein
MRLCRRFGFIGLGHPIFLVKGAATRERFSRVEGGKRFGVAAADTKDGDVSKIATCIQPWSMVPSECQEKTRA